MEEFCSALKELGAQYYDNADVSNKVGEFGLLKEETILYNRKPWNDNVTRLQFGVDK